MSHKHTITHIEIPAPDLAKAMRFYADVFHWRIEVITEGVYAFFIIEEKKSGGGLDGSLQPAPRNCGPQIVIDTEDIEKKLRDIVASGGRIIQGKTEIEGGHGYVAIFCDPNDNYLQIHSRK